MPADVFDGSRRSIIRDACDLSALQSFDVDPRDLKFVILDSLRPPADAPEQNEETEKKE